MTIADSDSMLLGFRYDPCPQCRDDDTWGNICYDPVAGLWRMWTHGDCATVGGGKIWQYTSTSWHGPWGNRTLSLDKSSTGGAWDEKQVGVPQIWYEAGQTRPWRMLYYGQPASGHAQIGLATSVDGTTWERKDTAGNALTSPVVPCGSGVEWDHDDIDMGTVIKVGDTYYFYYDTVGSASRQTGLATSTDLVTWTKHANNPFFTGMTDYDDAGHNGTADATAGFFCPDIVRWDRADGTTRYVMYICHWAPTNILPTIDCYVSDTPFFRKADRTYIGKIFDSNGSPRPTIEGISTVACDTPDIIVDDVTRNVKTSARTGNWVPMLIGVKGTKWTQAYMMYHKTLNGASLSDVCADLPCSNPTVTIAPTGDDANTVAKWIFTPEYGTYDLCGGGYHLKSYADSIDSKGAKFVAANSNFLRYAPAGATITPIGGITGDFTIEFSVQVDTADDWISGIRYVFCFGTMGANNQHFTVHFSSAAGPVHVIFLNVVSGGVAREISSGVLTTFTNGTLHRWAICCTGGKVYFFKDGVLLNAGGTAYNYPPDGTTNEPLYIGGGSATVGMWSGYIKELRFSNVARWTANYTPVAMAPVYKASGAIFSRVSDFTTAGAGGVALTSATPTGTSIAQKGRNASSGTDKSVTDGDFTALTTIAPATRYQQIELALATSDATVSPSITRMQPYQHELLEQREVKRNVDRGDGLKGTHRSINRL